MKKKISLITIILLVGIITVYALNKTFNFNPKSLSFTNNSKKKSVLSNFNTKYSLSATVNSDALNSKTEEEIITLTKKATYLLFGEANNTEETSEEYYKRHSDWKALRYNPEVPKDESNILGVDTDSREYKDDLISGMASATVFNQAAELGLIYQTFGDVYVTINNDIVISTIVLPNVKIKEQSTNNPMEYDYVDTNFIMYYYFKKLNNEWKLYYLYGESSDDISKYTKEVEKTQSKDMKAISYNSELSKIYNFSKLESMTNEDLNSIYNANIDKLVYFSSYYNNMVKAEANGFYITNNLIVTSWSYLEESLINAQVISVVDAKLNPIVIDGIVTANPDTDIAVIKVSTAKDAVTISNDNISVEDPSIIISSKNGSGYAIQSGIVTSNKGYIRSTIPITKNDTGSALFNQKGEVIGMNISKVTDSSISYAINKDVLKEIKDKFSSINYEDIDSISFSDLKDKYYYIKSSNEKIINTIPAKKWQEYSKIGNISNTINLELVKASYQDNIISLRYKNSLSSYIDGLKLAYNFKEQLVKSGFKLTTNTKSKLVYENKEYKVILMDQFDYLIVVMVKL